MSVYFVYRSHYEGPSGKHVRRLDAESVLGWFRAVWERAQQADDASEWVRTELGCAVYGFASIFEAARDACLPPPESDLNLESYLTEHLYVEGNILYQPHCLQVLTDDDEIELAYFFFDDHYLKENQGRAVYLLHEDWTLPTTSREKPFTPSIPLKVLTPQGTGLGTTYLAFLAFYDSANLSDLDVWGGPCQIEGVRVPELGDYLGEVQPDEDWPFELKPLRSQLPLADSHGVRLKTALERVAHLPVLRISETEFSSRLGLGTVEEARDEVESLLKTLRGDSVHQPSKTLMSVGEHLTQVCLSISP